MGTSVALLVILAITLSNIDMELAEVRSRRQAPLPYGLFSSEPMPLDMAQLGQGAFASILGPQYPTPVRPQMISPYGQPQNYIPPQFLPGTVNGRLPAILLRSQYVVDPTGRQQYAGQPQYPTLQQHVGPLQPVIQQQSVVQTQNDAQPPADTQPPARVQIRPTTPSTFYQYHTLTTPYSST